MNSNFNESFLADDVHYNQEGAKFIADIYLLVFKVNFLRQIYQILKFFL